MSRSERRRARRMAGLRQACHIANTYRCPDCLADVSLVRTTRDGVLRLDVHHDETCPTYARMRRRGDASPGPR